MKQASSQHRTSQRSAFTLLEVLIALGLTVLLVTAVYAAIDLHYRYSTAGRGEMARGQIFRAITRRVSEDISSIVMHTPEEETQSTSSTQAAEEQTTTGSGTQTVGGTTQTSETSAVGGLQQSGNPLTFGVVGSDRFVHLTVSRPSRDLGYSGVYGERTTGARSSDLLIVTYGIGPVTTDRWRSVNSEEIARRPMEGFGRRAVDLYDQQAVPDTLDEADVLAPEITQLQIRYFDGVQWLASWDSRTSGILPRAVEFTFGFWNEPRQQVQAKVIRNPTESGTVTSVRHVFNVPISTPATGEASQ